MREIIQQDDPILYQLSEPVTADTDENLLFDLVNDMTYYVKNGAFDKGCAGLSAVQLGVPICLIVVAYGAEQLALINPRIIATDGKTSPSHEACMSLFHATQYYDVRRYKIVKVSATRFDNKQPITIKARDLLGRTLQHEIDHLAGITIRNKK